MVFFFKIKIPNNDQYTSTKNQNISLHSEHLPMQLQIPPSTLIAKTSLPTPKPSPIILNPIPKEKPNFFHMKFFGGNSNQIN